MDPTLNVLLYSSIAAAAAALGALPLIGRERVPSAWIGWSNALASGMMLGAAYVLSVLAMSASPPRGAAGAAVGIGFIYWTHAASGTHDLDLNVLRARREVYGYKVVLVNTLHAASEGVAIGVAAAESLPFGIFMALAIAVHNVPEATILCAVLRGGGVRLTDAAGLAVATNVSQVLLAIVTFAVVSAAPGVHPWALGFAVGALVQLVMVELLPQSYRQAGRTSIAVVTSVAMGIVVLAQGVFL